MGNTWFNTLPYFTGLYALTPIFEHAAIYTETSLSLGKLYLSQEVLSQRLCVCLLILNARRVTLHVLLSIVVRPRTITKLPPTCSCLSTNTLSCATSHASVPRRLYSRKFTRWETIRLKPAGTFSNDAMREAIYFAHT